MCGNKYDRSNIISTVDELRSFDGKQLPIEMVAFTNANIDDKATTKLLPNFR